MHKLEINCKCRHCKPALREGTSIKCYCSLEPSSTDHKNKPLSICLHFFLTDHSKCDLLLVINQLK